MSLRYKSWSANANFLYSKGGYGRLPNFYRKNFNAVFDGIANVSKEMNDRWRNPGDELHTNIPAVYDKDAYHAARKLAGEVGRWDGPSSKTPLEMYDNSTIRTAKTDNIRLRSIGVNYIVRGEALKKLRMQSLIFNLQAENLFLSADKAWFGRDPESGDSNTPLPKVFTFGLNVV